MKYTIGQTVYRPSTTQVRKRIPCPDCNNKGTWTLTSPAGQKFEVGCPRCGGGSRIEMDIVRGELSYIEYLPVVNSRKVTGFRTPGNYFLENGAWDVSEDKIFATEAEALAVATTMAQEATDRTRERSELNLNGLSYKVALAKTAWHQVWDAQYRYTRLREALEALAKETQTFDGEDINDVLDDKFLSPSISMKMLDAARNGNIAKFLDLVKEFDYEQK